MKVSELTGAALDWAVAKALSLNEEDYVEIDNLYGPVWRGPEYSSDWAHGGPIIEREEIALEPMTHDEHSDGWLATRVEGPAVCMEFGPTMLIAAMRCFVASHLGDEVEVPAGLVA